MLVWVTLRSYFKQIQNRGFKPAMMGDLGSAKAGCSLYLSKLRTAVLGGGGEGAVSTKRQNSVRCTWYSQNLHHQARTPKLLNCNRSRKLDSRVCTELYLGLSIYIAARGMPASFLIGSQCWELGASSSFKQYYHVVSGRH